MEKNQDFSSLLAQGTDMLHKGQPAEAIPYLKKAHLLQPDHIDAGINLSGAYILSKKFKLAVDVLQPLSEQNPDNSKIWINLGAAYLGNPVLAREDEQNRAISAFKRALEIDPVAHSVAYNIGLIYRDKRELGKAEFWFRQAVKHNPHDKDARRLLDKMKVAQSKSNKE